MNHLIQLSLLATMPMLLLGQINLPSVANGIPISETWTVTSGTTVNQYTLVQRDSHNPTMVKPASVASGSDVLGIAMTTVTGGSGATVQVARYGQISCYVDTGGAAHGDLAVMGSTNNTYCGDSTQTNVAGVAIGTRVIGYFLSNAIANSTVIVELTPGLMGTSITGVPVTATTITATYAVGAGHYLIIQAVNNATSTSAGVAAWGVMCQPN